MKQKCVVVVVVWFGDPCESPGALLLKVAAAGQKCECIIITFIVERFVFYKENVSLKPKLWSMHTNILSFQLN